MLSLDGIDDLIGLFDQRSAKGRRGLLAIPRTAAGSPQARDDFPELIECLAHRKE
jgi:hypothetical protein